MILLCQKLFYKILIVIENAIMKQVILSVLMLFGLSTLLAQVGINTTFPYTNSVFHIDAAGNNTSSTTVSSAQAADDIVIDNQGQMGVGIVSPTAKLHIDSSNGALKPIRIADGSQGVNKYLFSDAEGKATWKDKPVPNGVAYYSRTAKAYPRNVDTEVTVEVNSKGYSRITIPNAGNYVFMLRWFGSIPTLATLPATSKITSLAIVQLRKVTGTNTSVVVDQTSVYTVVASGGASIEPRFSFTESLFASNLNAGDEFFITVNPDLALGYDWSVGRALGGQGDNTTFYPSVIVYNI